MAEVELPQFKTCTKCGVEKPHTLEFFPFRHCRGKKRLGTRCRSCEAESQRERYAKAPDKKRAWLREYRRKYPDRTRAWDEKNYKNNKAGTDYHARRYARLDKEKAREDIKRWKAENPDKARALEIARNARIIEQRRSDPEFRENLNKKSREWRSKNRLSDADRDKRNAAHRAWCRNNKERQNAYKRKRDAVRRKTDVNFRLSKNLRRRIHLAIKRGWKSGSAVKMLGCSIDEFRLYIESLFRTGMTWENWGVGAGGKREWHLDHKEPVKSFDLADPVQMARCCHHSNLQPLWSKDNLTKGAN